jgi:hypothetical protein
MLQAGHIVGTRRCTSYMHKTGTWITPSCKTPAGAWCHAQQPTKRRLEDTFACHKTSKRHTQKTHDSIFPALKRRVAGTSPLSAHQYWTPVSTASNHNSLLMHQNLTPLERFDTRHWFWMPSAAPTQHFSTKLVPDCHRLPGTLSKTF